MGTTTRWIRTLVSELGRRGVVRAAGLYAVGAWLVVQVGVAVFPVLLLPGWALRALVIVAILGFPVSVVVAWAYDLTPGGLRRVDRSDELDEQGAPVEVLPGWTRLVLVLLVVSLTGTVGWLSWTRWLEPRAAITATAADEVGALDPSQVAVLYFDDLSEEGELQYLADGITDAVIHELAQIPALGVVPRNGVKPFRNSGILLDSIARRLDVGTLVEGGIDRTPDGLVASVQLVNGTSARQLMNRRIRVRGADPVVLRDSIVAEAARLLGQRLGRELQLRDLRDDTESAEAWEHVIRSRELVEEAGELRWTARDTAAARAKLREADRRLARAEGADGDWLRPLVMRGEVARRMATMATNRMDSDSELLLAGIGHAERALERDPAHAPALGLRGRIRDALNWITSGAEADTLLEAAEADLRRAVELDPGDAEAWVVLAQLLRRKGEFPEASWAADRALEADPFLINAEPGILLAQGMVLLDLGDWERAGTWAATGRRRYPGDPSFAAFELVTLAGGPVAIEPPAAADTAWKLVGTVEESFGVDHWPHGHVQVAAVLAVTGQRDSALAVLSRLDPPDPNDGYFRYYEALVHLHLGDHDRAFDLLEEYLAVRPDRRGYTANEWWWNPLRDEPRFRRMVGLE